MIYVILYLRKSQQPRMIMNKKTSLLVLKMVLLISSCSAHALMLASSAFSNNGDFPYQYGYCQPNGKGQVKSSHDISPPLRWSTTPAGTKSIALIVSDSNVPNDPNFNVEGKIITPTAERVTFYH